MKYLPSGAAASALHGNIGGLAGGAQQYNRTVTGSDTVIMFSADLATRVMDGRARVGCLMCGSKQWINNTL